MATIKKDITDEWTALTTAGKSGTFWWKTYSSGNLVIDHSTTGTGGLNTNKGYYPSKHNNVPLALTADNASDIFYAKCIETDDTAEIIMDIV